MVFCPKCGAEVAEGSNFCPKCGAQIVSSVPATPTARRGQSEIGGILILIGGILGILGSLWIIPMMYFFTGPFQDGMGRFMGGFSGFMAGTMGRFIGGMMLVGTIIGIIGGILAIYIWTRMKSGDVKSLGTYAIIIGAVMLFTTHFFAGILILIGGILSYSSK